MVHHCDEVLLASFHAAGVRFVVAMPQHGAEQPKAKAGLKAHPYSAIRCGCSPVRPYGRCEWQLGVARAHRPKLGLSMNSVLSILGRIPGSPILRSNRLTRVEVQRPLFLRLPRGHAWAASELTFVAHPAAAQQLKTPKSGSCSHLVGGEKGTTTAMGWPKTGDPIAPELRPVQGRQRQ